MFCLAHLDAVRAAEIELVASYLRPGARILEIGAGTGQQAHALARRGFDIAAIEIASSNYSAERIFPIIDYDGRVIPFADASFDIVFSSNVLEHVPDLAQMSREIRRVLAPGGLCIHAMPTHAWRFWTSVSAFPDALQQAFSLRHKLLPRAGAWRAFARAWLQVARHLAGAVFQPRHGERGNSLKELWLFHPRWWRQSFRENGFEILRDAPMGLFYTGHMVFGLKWSIERRAHLARVLGSACHLFVTRPVPAGDGTVGPGSAQR
ncbi:class I SAM-dependent methyltransferase [Microvirga massiliensis]|uniref:class I SAM-dependent methyltransferase n=1 Tax=Microvirga massiliensis TaxID=1033741 RepID=UPI00065FEEF6|nr:class I SAM-dependent methyltransferase [Microvirga massiliensis]